MEITLLRVIFLYIYDKLLVMKKFVFSLLLLSIKSFAQDSLRNHQVQFSLNSFSISDVPRYNIGYFYPINEKYKVGGTIGFGSNDILVGSDGNKTWTEIVGKPKDNYKIFEIRPEIQKHFRRSRKTPHFIGLQFQYLYHTEIFKERVRFYTAKEDYRVNADYGEFLRIKYGVLFEYGMQIHFNKNKSWGMVPKLGVGIKNRYVKYKNLKNVNRYPYDDWEGNMFIYFDLNPTNFYEYTGTVIGLDMNFDLSLFYRF